MLVKNIIDEDFANYKKPSMFIGTCKCDWKCCKEGGFDIAVCQNSPLAQQKNISVSVDFLVSRYMINPITSAVVIGGLEPMLQFSEVLEFIKELRKQSDDDIVIYTGYYQCEIQDNINKLMEFKNIVIKFGRYLKDNTSRFDDVLGVNLASNNQYGVKIS